MKKILVILLMFCGSIYAFDLNHANSVAGKIKQLMEEESDSIILQKTIKAKKKRKEIEAAKAEFESLIKPGEVITASKNCPMTTHYDNRSFFLVCNKNIEFCFLTDGDPSWTYNKDLTSPDIAEIFEDGNRFAGEFKIVEISQSYDGDKKSVDYIDRRVIVFVKIEKLSQIGK